jgi:hypothetical protein
MPTPAKLESTVLSDVQYDAPTHILTITFKNGRKYNYAKVPPEVYSKLMAAESHGKFFRQHILGKYQYQEHGK